MLFSPCKMCLATFLLPEQINTSNVTVTCRVVDTLMFGESGSLQSLLVTLPQNLEQATFHNLKAAVISFFLP